MTDTATRTRVTEYIVSSSLFPEDDINGGMFEIKVAYRGNDLWAIIRHSRCLGRDGAWDWLSIPEDNPEGWLSSHRFPLDEALRLAEAELPRLRVNGKTAAEVAEWVRQEEAADA